MIKLVISKVNCQIEFCKMTSSITDLILSNAIVHPILSVASTFNRMFYIKAMLDDPEKQKKS